MSKVKSSFPKAAWAFQGSGVADPRAGAWVHTDDIGNVRTKKREAHTSPTVFGMGDYYGTSHKNPMGKVRGDSTVGFRPATRKQLRTAPKSVV